MAQLDQRFDRIYVHREALGSEVLNRIKAQLPQVPLEIVDEAPLKEKRGSLSAQEFSQSKRLLYIAPFPGTFFKRCPGSRPGLVCCNYFVLNLGQQCDMNCSYCYLQSFINSPTLTVYSNIDQAIDELRELHKELGSHKVRIGTGEVIDSLSLDDLTHYSRKLIAVFREFPNWTLEFKTKSSKVNQFLDVPHAGNVVVSWSINPQFVIQKEEAMTASLEERLDAAELCRNHEFPVAFHIDPMIWHEEWKENYAGLVNEITSRFEPKDVNVISVGALRFQASQRHIMRERFGMQSLVTQAEVFPGDDGKLRYDQSLRREMFDSLVSDFKQRDPKWRIFLCMENSESWLGTFAQLPQRQSDLGELFNAEPVRIHRRIEAHSS